MFCKHKWTVLVEKMVESPLIRHGGAAEGIPVDLMMGTHIVIMSCEKCGKVYESVEKV